jgi:FkbM family methyltransferase
MKVAPQKPLPYRVVRYPVKYITHKIWENIVEKPELSKYLLTNYAHIYSRIDPRFGNVITDINLREDGLWKLTLENQSYLFPSLDNNAHNLKRGTLAKILIYGFDSDPMVSRYENQQVKIEDGDLVVDVGDYIGMFAAYARSKGAEKVYTIEPTPTAYRSLEYNTKEDSGIQPFQLGIWSENGMMTLEESSDPTDNRIATGDGVEVNTKTIERFVSENDIDSIDFLKIDVEGLELHVLKGIGNITVQKIGVDAGEGGAENPAEIYEFLEEAGYTVWRQDHMIYAKLE